MDNRHPAKNVNANHSASHSMNELDDRLSMLTVNDMTPANLGTIRPNQAAAMPMNDNLYQNMAPRVTPLSGNSTRRLNPTAQIFIPRSMMNPPPTMVYACNSTHLANTSNSQSSTNNHALLNGNVNNIQSSNSHEGENDIEDYVALSYLKEFISTISNKPSMYELGIAEVTGIVNSYLDEDECVLELIVNQIVDQSIIDVNFRYNGVRLCFHFMENIRPTNTGQTFKTILFKRCQRECSRKITKMTSVNTYNHLRGLALFTADLYARSKAAQLAEHLPNLLMNILTPDGKADENVKCVCQTIKLCGQQLDSFFAEQGKDDMKEVFKKLGEKTECDISVHIADMAKNLIKLAANNWVEQPRASIAPSIRNPYHNGDLTGESLPLPPGGPPTGYHQAYEPYNPTSYSPELYDFGNCGDEFDEEVCHDFENFLANLPDNS